MSGGYDSSKGNESFLFIACLGLAVVFFGIKYNFEYIILIWKYIRIGFLFPFTWIPNWFPFYGKLEISEAFHYLLDMPFTDIMPITAKRIDLHYLKWLSWVPGLIMFKWGFSRFVSSGGVNHRYNMEELIVRFGTLYSDLNPYIADNPVFKPIVFKRSQKSTYEWAMSISPRDFSLMTPPMGLEKKAKKNLSLNNPIWDGKKGFDHDLADRAFSEQMGDKFTGIQNLRDYEKVIFDKISDRISVTDEEKIIYFKSLALPLLGAKGHRAIPDSRLSTGMKALKEKIIEDINQSKELAQRKKLRFNPKLYMQPDRIEKYVEQESLSSIYKLIKSEDVMSSHAFVRCGIMRLMTIAREGGVLASNQFRWLKKKDRTLWFGISGVGRRVSFVESGGPFAHLLLEIEIGRPISHPEVSEAVNGLFIALECDID